MAAPHGVLVGQFAFDQRRKTKMKVWNALQGSKFSSALPESSAFPPGDRAETDDHGQILPTGIQTQNTEAKAKPPNILLLLVVH